MTRRGHKKKDWVNRYVIYMYESHGELKYGVHVCHAKTDEEAEQSCTNSVIVPHFIWRVVAKYY